MYENKKGRVGLNLLGGGVTGAFFHFGALAALDDHLSKKSTDLDTYVGTSAGSLVAMTLAVGLKPQEVVEAIFKDNTDFFAISRKDIYRFSLGDTVGEILKFFWTLFYITYLKAQGDTNAPSYFWGLKDALPAGLFSMRYYEQWIKSFLERGKYPHFFSEIQKEFFIPSFDLDLCQRVIFGSPGFRHIPFYKAIPASSAIPIFFRPVEIEGRHYTDGGIQAVAHLDILVKQEAELIIMINPMVPIRNDLQKVAIRTVFEDRGRIRDKGLTYVYDQTLRNELRTRVHAAMNFIGYRSPAVDILLIEPDDDDPTMFLFNPMDFNSRKQIVEYGYELTRKKLRQNAELWRRTLDRHRITLTGA